MKASYRDYAARAEHLFAALETPALGALVARAEARRRELYELVSADAAADRAVADDFKRATILSERGRAALEPRAIARAGADGAERGEDEIESRAERL